MMRCGFHTLSEEKCKKLVQEVTVFDYMDFQDFTDFSEKAILEERKGYRQLLKTWEPNSCDNFVDPVDNVKSFMKMLKVICTRKSVLDILDVAGLKDEPCNSPQEMLRFLAAYQACEGFSKQDNTCYINVNNEVSSLRAAFKSCEEKPHAVGPEGRLIDPKSLSFGLLRFGGIYFVEAWRAMKHYQKACAAGVSFYEFLVCARRVRETQLQQVAEYVETICGEGENFIEELRSLCRPLGFTLQKVEVVEICQEKGIGLDGPLSLDCAWDFAEHVRSCHGFRKAEQAELVQSFLKFSQGEAELAVLKILELLNWLGLGGALEEAHQMLRQVDFNDNGVLDETEFLRLMRLQKETSVRASRIFAALAECDIFTENHLLEVITLKHGIKTASVNFSHAGVRRGSGKQPGISWDTWVILAEEARKVTPVWKRRSASFKEAEVSELRKAFGAEEVPVSDLIWMLLDSGMPLQRAEDRQRFHEALEEARRAALDAGSAVEDVGELGTQHVHFAPFLHLIRGYLQSIKQKQMEREELALRSVDFAATEPCHHLSYLVRRLASQPRVSCSEVIRMAASIGARIKMSQRSMLRKKIREFSSERRSELDQESQEELPDEDSVEDGVDFAGFLQIMQWMQDCNWCNINAAAEEKLLQPNQSSFSRCVSAP
eukprot:g14075.t1